ncbi:MAG TPA: LysR family transcriptional regulator substrate-binding protein, partial [Phycisphaerae bacterium]|nr:LysR family transcriptional regulator substrate-binding protein [Phycisphaerae bacterium]
NRSLDIIPLEDEQLVVVCPPGDPLAHRESVVASDLEGRKFAAFSGNIPTRRHIDKLLKAAKVRVNITLEFDNIELLKRVIMIGSAVSILPEESVRSEALRGDLAFVPFRYPKRWTRPVGIVRRKDRQPTPAEVQFLTILAPKTKKKFFKVEE